MTTQLSFTRGTALYVAAVLGPGILTLPALAARTAGPAFLIPLVLILVLSALLAVTFVGLGRATGGRGLADYVRQGFGDTAGAVVGVLFYVGVPPGVAALGLFGGEYLRAAVGGQHTPAAVALVLIALTYALNAAGLRLSSAAQVLLTGILLTLLLVAIVLAAPHATGTNFTPFAPHGWGAMAPAAFLLVWALTGWEASANLFATLRPGDVLRITTTAVVIIAVAFLGLSLTLVGVLGSENTSASPVADLLRVAIGPWGVVVAVVLALTLTLANMNSYVASLGALGRDLVPRLPSRHDASLWIPTVIAVASLAATWGRADAATVLVGVTAASQVPVLLLSCGAALRILPGATAAWWAALAAVVAVAALLVAAGAYLICPVVIVTATVVWRRLRPGRQTVVAPR
ncbi:APC family permease [Aeromicrobium sp. CF4.19]|uniref:APC family permease n=1 Tax=Aeromicrobium sp. CF4.19 TaxID=3373082 RepID=UPI003EE4B76D